MANQSLNGITFLSSNRQLFNKSEPHSKSVTNLTTLLKTSTEAEHSEKLIGNNQIRSKVANIKQSIENNSKAISALGKAEEGLQKINELLQLARKTITDFSKVENDTDQNNHHQLEIDKNIQSIDLLVTNTTYEGKNLLNGDATLTESYKPTSIVKIDTFSAQFKNNLDTEIPFSITALPDYAKIHLIFDKDQLAAKTEITISGPYGFHRFNFAEKSTLIDISKTIENENENTGVTAIAYQTSLLLRSNETGSHISFSVTDNNNSGFLAGATGQSNQTISNIEAIGQDVQGTINGEYGHGVGQTLQANTPQFAGKITFEIQPNILNGAFAIKTKGHLFENNDSIFPLNDSLSIENFSPINLGNNIGNLASLTTTGENMATENSSKAISILDDAITSVNITRSRIHHFQKINLEKNANNLQVSLENTIASENRIRDLDFAAKTASFTKSQILIQSNSSISAQANTSTGSVIDLLK